ncbi:hypothetical protein ACIU1J_03565 [Azospirillum doebereinerae]|uniref:hypothetical protein n=1 Tax=Azospirillum doebereinerae TaxID=92933 RepID=UPI00384D2030
MLAEGKLHVDDTLVPVLAPGAGKTRTGRRWGATRATKNGPAATPHPLEGRAAGHGTACRPSRSFAMQTPCRRSA